MNTIDPISWKLSQFTNEFGDEIEMENIHFQEEYQVTVNICDESPPFRDITASATHPRSKRKSAFKAMKELYKEQYP